MIITPRPSNAVALAVLAYVLWGLSALYWPLLAPSGAVEILAMRIVLSLVLLAGLTTLTRGWRRVGALITAPGWRRRVGLLAAAAVLTAVNWGVFIWATSNAMVVDASLGYFINPLFMVVLGVVVFGERLDGRQWLALGSGAVAVVILVVGYGQMPWVALTLATTFGLYGLIKKSLRVGAIDGMLIETAVLFVPALGYVLVQQSSGTATFGHVSPSHTLLVAGTCAAMLPPMLLFSAAANHAKLSVVGILQYIEPVIQFLIGLVVFQEPVAGARWVAFALVWTALILLALSGMHRRPTWMRGWARSAPVLARRTDWLPRHSSGVAPAA